MSGHKLTWERWTIDDLGRVRPSDGPDPDGRAHGWIDPRAGVGGIDEVAGEPADGARLPAEVLDLLERRYPRTRWFVPIHRAA